MQAVTLQPHTSRMVRKISIVVSRLMPGASAPGKRPTLPSRGHPRPRFRRRRLGLGPVRPFQKLQGPGDDGTPHDCPRHFRTPPWPIGDPGRASVMERGRQRAAPIFTRANHHMLFCSPQGARPRSNVTPTPPRRIGASSRCRLWLFRAFPGGTARSDLAPFWRACGRCSSVR